MTATNQEVAAELSYIVYLTAFLDYCNYMTNSNSAWVGCKNITELWRFMQYVLIGWGRESEHSGVKLQQEGIDGFAGLRGSCPQNVDY